MGVDGVVGERPENAARVEQQRGLSEGAGMGRPSHQRAPIKCKPQNELRPIGNALHEGIDGENQAGGEASDDGRAIELQKYSEAKRQQYGKENQRALQAGPAGGQGA